MQPALYLAAMGLGLGGLVKAHSGAVSGLDYLDFVAPGLLVASTMQLSVGEALWPVLAGVKWMKFFHGVVATPIRPSELYGGYVLWIAIRSVLGSSAFLLVAAVLGAIPSVWGVLAIPAAALCAAAFCAPIAAFSVTQDSDLSFPMIMRLGVLPLFLFSGTFFPISQLPSGSAAGRVVVAAVARGRARARCDDGQLRPCSPTSGTSQCSSCACSSACGSASARSRGGSPHDRRNRRAARTRIFPRRCGGGARGGVVERNVTAYRRIWYIFLSGFAEPLFFLLSIGIGVGNLVGELHVGGRVVDYRTFVAPGLLATAAMNGALLDTTFNFFFKFKYAHTYDGVVATPLGPRDVVFGEITWALLRGAIYSAVFLITMVAFGDVASWWSVLGVAGRGADRLRIRGRRARRHDVHALVHRLRLREHGDDPAVPVLGDVLPAGAATPTGAAMDHPVSRRCTRASCSSGRWSSATSTGRCS